MVSRQELYKYISKYPDNRIINYRDGNNIDLQKTIVKNVDKYIFQVKPFAELFRGSNDYETAKNIWEYCRTEQKYIKDGDTQKIKSPSGFIKYNGDCKSFALFISCLFAALDIPQTIEFAAYKSDAVKPSHVYNRFYYKGNWFPVDGTYNFFGQELPTTVHLRYEMNEPPSHISDNMGKYYNGLYNQENNFPVYMVGVLPEANNQEKPETDQPSQDPGKGTQPAPEKPTGTGLKKVLMGIGTGILLYKVFSK